MAKIIDIKSKKPINPKGLMPYKERTEECIYNIKTKGYCACEMCTDKLILSNKLFNITRWLCLDYMKKTGKNLYYPDMLDIITVAHEQVKNIVFPQESPKPPSA